ncbi:MAG: hypothetical protein HQL47_04475 [Gammaproteobacteria bacterium]|nr:hypothetical protein [Gammaproteobacteria bacterium]
MQIDNNLAAYYQPGLIQPQVDPRLQQEQPRRQNVTLDAVPQARKPAQTLDASEYERVRNRVEREQGGRVMPDGVSTFARNALSAYDSIERDQERLYNSQVLGIDTYA